MFCNAGQLNRRGEMKKSVITTKFGKSDTAAMVMLNDVQKQMTR